MANINLRPWREERRAELQRQFVGMLVFVAMIGGATWFFWNQQVNAEISYQNSRNSYVQKEIKSLDKLIEEIKDLDRQRQELVDRMQVIQDLQGNRPVIVRMFDEVVRTLPDGVHYRSLERKGDRLSINGVAESNNRISNLMRRFDDSIWFANPNLTEVEAVDDRGREANGFDLSVSQVNPNQEEDAP